MIVLSGSQSPNPNFWFDIFLSVSTLSYNVFGNHFFRMQPMATTSFTTRIDTDLKAELEQIARFEDRSASYMANQAIKAMVEERKATRELIELGLALVEQGAPSIPASEIHDWFMADDDRPFPEARPAT